MISTVTIPLEEYLELRKIREDIQLNHTYLLSTEGFITYNIVTKDETIKNLLAENKKLIDKIDELKRSKKSKWF